MPSVRNNVVVITGASSGIGRAAARAFAARGARLVLAARRYDALLTVVDECRSAGTRAIAVQTDVTKADQVFDLAEAALKTFGQIDVWVNNAGTGVFGPFTEAPIELHRQVIKTNLLGAMYAAAAVLPVFQRQGHGTLINNISMGAWMPIPYASAYAASKFGLRGFTASLRQELQPCPDIHICAVFPALIDTPGFIHGANVSGRALDPGGPMGAPEDVAETLVNLVLRPRHEVAVGWTAWASKAAYGLAPGPTEQFAGFVLRRYLRRARPAARVQGAVLRPQPQGTSTSGGLRHRNGSGWALGPVLGALLLMLGTAAAMRAMTARRRAAI